MKEENNNKTVAKFIYKGQKYEIDELLDTSSREQGFGEYDVFRGNEYVAHLSMATNEFKDNLVKEAKWQLDNIKI